MSAGLLAIVPARGGSKAVPGKNVADVGGKPLIAWTIEAALAARSVARVVVSTDDEGIADVARRHGAEVPFLRPARFATDDASAADVAAHALGELPGFEAFALLQPTSPLRTAADVDAAFELFERSAADTLVSVREATEPPEWMFRVGDGGRLEPVLPPARRPAVRQDLEPAWLLNGALYLARVGPFLERRVFADEGTVAYPMPAERSLDVDTAEELERARALLARHP